MKSQAVVATPESVKEYKDWYSSRYHMCYSIVTLDDVKSFMKHHGFPKVKIKERPYEGALDIRVPVTTLSSKAIHITCHNLEKAVERMQEVKPITARFRLLFANRFIQEF